MSRIAATFSRLKAQHRPGLIPYIMAFDPDRETSIALLDALAENGADLIEIGLPFSDPMADGPVIQAAGLRALKNGANIAGVLELVRGFRARHATTPVILMGYYNLLYRYGIERFCADAASAGVDGLLLVDLPPEEEDELTEHSQAHGLDLIRLVAPTSDEARLATLAKSASGFIYYISVAGITGAKSADSASMEAQVKQIRKFTDLPIAIGFGIKTPEQAKAAARHAEAVVVGSALVDVIHQAGAARAVAEAGRFMRALAQAL